ncbi:MAG: tRNA (adenosine(37)-N6)-threonylcarbamoyltransferase complex dimerization subunit type 1 TsaB, partial [Gemmatimonadota bacterium]|nr:tRNA (adenosine(37)-N6)-threonylcarbamoyltransferase complex dimerization subunit type 1 TsaB [Gemmatimonadota bacterium]
MTKFLGIETSTPVCSVALACDARVVVEYTLELGSHHSERLQPMVEMVLREASLSVGDLDGVAVAAGPGSFTGLRIGLGLAQGLCRGADLVFVCVSTLAGMAFGTW